MILKGDLSLKKDFGCTQEEITRQAGPLNFSAERLLSHDDVCRHMIKERRKINEIRLGYTEGMQDIRASPSAYLICTSISTNFCIPQFLVQFTTMVSKSDRLHYKYNGLPCDSCMWSFRAL